jgi:hypothetical protein
MHHESEGRIPSRTHRHQVSLLYPPNTSSSFLVIVGRSPRCQLICFDLYGYDHEHSFHAFALALTLDGNTENTYKELHYLLSIMRGSLENAHSNDASRI